MNKIPAIIIGICLISACQESPSNENNQDDKDVTSEDVKEEIEEAVETGKEYTFVQRDAFLARMKTRRDNTKAQITELRARLDKITDETKMAFSEKVRSLQQQQNDLGAKLDELKNASEDQIAELESEADSLITKLEQAIEAAQKELNK